MRWISHLVLTLGAIGMAARQEGGLTKPPGDSFRGPLPALSDEQRRLAPRLRTHVDKLAGEIGERNVWQIDALNRSADYIAAVLNDAGYEVRTQEYESRGQTVRNLEVEVPGSTRKDQVVVIGAHYDSVRGCPAANDNGTGVAAVLEMASGMSDRKPARTVRFVFFVNEEPPFFQTAEMGSMVYAKSCRERGDDIVAMLSIETIGYYDDAPGSQKYPDPIGRLYPDTANFIAFVSNPQSRPLMFDVVESFRRHAQFPSEGAAAPEFIPGIGWSDHWAFWRQGYNAVMVTDTAPFRYPHYHRETDTPDKLDFDRTARVVDGLIRVVEDLSNPKAAGP